MDVILKSVADVRSQGGLLRDIAISLVLAVLMLLEVNSPEAHEMRPAIATLSVGPSSEIEVRLTLNLEAYLARIGPDHADTSQSANATMYESLRTLSPLDLQGLAKNAGDALGQSVIVTVDGHPVSARMVSSQVPEIGDTAFARLSEVVFQGTIPPSSQEIVWAVDDRIGDSVVRLKKAGTTQTLYSEYVSRGQSSKVMQLDNVIQQSAGQVFRNYVLIGYTHIVPQGLDHILFVVGLFLLTPRLKGLLVQITSFTLAHSVTLALGMLGWVSLPPQIVEPLIAASIVYVAIENVFTSRLNAWRPLLVFGFGLLHGLGFAGVLNEVGLQPVHFVTGLVAFNFGVELGQLSVVALCFLAVGFWFKSKAWYRNAITVPASIAVAMVGAYWFVERVI